MIWLVGCKGMLGTDLGKAFTQAGLDWVGTDREVDFTDPQALEAFGQGKAIEWVVNCAAYTAVDRAEDEPEFCRKLNVEGPACLARWCQNHQASLVHISTDYVFSGTGNQPYTEADPVAPQGVYGQTKADGEEAVRNGCARHYILRTAWLYGASGPNFIYTMLRLMGNKDTLGVVADQWGAPTWTVDLAGVLVALIQRGGGDWGTYHTSGEGRCSWHKFAEAILEEGRTQGLLDPSKVVAINALTTDQYPTKARRPAWSVLSKEKLKTTFGLTFPDWRSSLNKFLISLTAFQEQRKILRDHVDSDLDTARFLMESGRYAYGFFLYQQGIEKALKVLIGLRTVPTRTHKLVLLAHEAGIAMTSEETQILEDLSSYYLLGRYDKSVSLTGEKANEIQKQGEAIWIKISKYPGYFL